MNNRRKDEKMKYSVCITTPEISEILPLALLAGSFDEKMKKAALYGYNGVELMTTDPALLDFTEVEDSLLTNKLEISAVSSGAVSSVKGLTLLAADEKTRISARKKLSELIWFAGKTGTGIVTIGSFRGRAAAAGGAAGAETLLGKILKEAAEEAAAVNVSLALEPINRFDTDFLKSAAETIEFVKSTGCPNIGILLDTFHMNIEEGKFSDCFENALSEGMLRHVHIGDSNRMPPGKGHIDFISIISVLKKHNYSGYMSAELLAGSSPDDSARQTIEAIRQFELLSSN